MSTKRRMIWSTPTKGTHARLAMPTSEKDEHTLHSSRAHEHGFHTNTKVYKGYTHQGHTSTACQSPHQSRLAHPW
eukprot:scaffold156427_cov19-Tisochrysis_lutea.AAC.1